MHIISVQVWKEVEKRHDKCLYKKVSLKIYGISLQIKLLMLTSQIDKRGIKFNNFKNSLC